MASNLRLVAIFLILARIFYPSVCLVHHLTIHNDDRHVFKIETFGFIPGGKMSITLKDFALHSHKSLSSSTIAHHGNNTLSKSSNSSTINEDYQIGFVMRHAESESAAQQDLETIVEKNQCILDKLNPKDVILDVTKSETWKSSLLTHEITNQEIGLYSLIFARCKPTGPHLISFQLEASFINPGPNYLSAGDAPLPTLYLVYFFLYFAALLLWLYMIIVRDPIQYGTVHHIHYMMAALLCVKVLSLFFESIRYHYIAIYGVSEMWSIVYYIFAALKGVMLFTVILLIGKLSIVFFYSFSFTT
jgi:G protein-coupled receptor 107